MPNLNDGEEENHNASQHSCYLAQFKVGRNNIAPQGLAQLLAFSQNQCPSVMAPYIQNHCSDKNFPKTAPFTTSV
jgi:hypothetical protein